MQYNIVNGEDSNAPPVLNVYGSICQPGFLCRAPCEPFNNVHLDVTDYATGEKVGIIRKTWGGFLRDYITDAGIYEVEFGKVQAPEYKGMLVATALFLSEEYFTRGGQEQRDDSVLGLMTHAAS